MLGDFKRKDLRVLKSHKALTDAMLALLETRNFNQITVNDLCGRALISRSTFYAHFLDKYDFLQYWLAEMGKDFPSQDLPYGEIEQRLNRFFCESKNIIRNLIEDAKDETRDLLCEFTLSLLDIDTESLSSDHQTPGDVVMCNVCCGGVLNYLLWQVKNKFPADLPVVNPHIHKALAHFPKISEKKSRTPQ